MHDDELDRFKSDIHLVQYAAERYGYQRDRRESSARSHVLRHPSTDDKIVVRQDDDGHWTYFSVRDSTDSGTVIDFVQARGGRGLREVREELRRYLGDRRPDIDLHGETARVTPRPPLPEDRSPAEAFARALRTENSVYLNARGIRAETLSHPRFADTWRIGPHGNVFFAHTDDAGIVTGFEVKNQGFTGFASGGRKTAWQSAARQHDEALVIAESAIDALSHFQLHVERALHARYLSTAGHPSRSQLEVLDRVLAYMPRASTVVAAVDSDVAGEALAGRLEDLTRRHRHLAFQRDAPPGAKDWNEVLQRIEHDYIRSLTRGPQRALAGPER
jgi:hypothetical protein